MAGQHTPGPWAVHDANDVWNADEDDAPKRKVATANANIGATPRGRWPPDPDWLTAEANARLIAAAPDLLAACDEAASEIRSLRINGLISHDDPSAHETIGRLEAAIAKARGAAE